MCFLREKAHPCQDRLRRSLVAEGWMAMVVSVLARATHLVASFRDKVANCKNNITQVSHAVENAVRVFLTWMFYFWPTSLLEK
jgi:hypothetical protein